MNCYYEKFTNGTVKCIEEEIPFEIPESWEWVRLEELGIFKGGKTPSMHNPKFWNGDINWVTSKDMKSTYISNSILKITEDALCEMEVFPIGTLLFVARSGILKRLLPVAFLSKESTINQDLKALLLYCRNISKYIYYVLKGSEFFILQNYVKSVTTVESLKFEEFKKLLVALPPLSEQNRIIEKIEEIEALVDNYEQCEQTRTRLDANLPDLLKKSILQYAIQGKLVQQDPSAEPANKLLERVRDEKKRLIKEKKIKPDKHESVIFKGVDNKYYEKIGDRVACIEEEIPFHIPESWEWTRLGTIFQHCTGKALNASNKKGIILDYITTSNLYWDKFELTNLRKMPFTDEEIDKCTAIKGDLLVCEGGDIGRAAIWNFDNSIRIQNHIHKLRVYVPLCTMFYYHIFYFYKYTGLIGGKGIGIQGLSSKVLHNLFIPLPPLQEQERIVSKIESLLNKITSC